MAAGQKTPDMVFQLSVNSAGTIRGNYYNQVSESTLAVHGAVDKKTQRAAWQIGNNKELIVENRPLQFDREQIDRAGAFQPEQQRAVSDGSTEATRSVNANAAIVFRVPTERHGARPPWPANWRARRPRSRFC